jgi:hypothetical protein
MSQRVIVLDEAEDELIEAQNWYETQRSGLGQEFRSAIEEAMERLLKAPLAASQSSILPHPLVPGEFWSNDFRIRLCSLTTTRIFGSLHLPISIGDQVIGENG